MKNLQIIKEKLNKMHTLTNYIIIEDVKDIESFINTKEEYILNTSTVVNQVVAKYENAMVLRFKFDNKKSACKWLNNNIEDFKTIERSNKSNNKKLLLAIQY